MEVHQLIIYLQVLDQGSIIGWFKLRLGSSRQMAKQLAFSGIMNNVQALNPDFYNWNKVKVRYCDGSSFTGDVEPVDPVSNLHYRGSRVWLAVMEDLLLKGMNKAEKALLSGCSAGGLTSILHCDSFRDLLPISTIVKCLSDAGYFINVKDITGVEHIKAYFNDIVTTHGSTKNLPTSCSSVTTTANMCFFPQYVASQINTPLFILNAAYDSWQIKNILAPGVADPHDIWHNCKLDIKQCSSAQIEMMQGFRTQFLDALAKVGSSSATGMFINSCYAHCQTEMQETWLSSNSPMLDKIPIAKAIGDWFYEQDVFQKIDCPYPCDSTCHNRIFEDNSQA